MSEQGEKGKSYLLYFRRSVLTHYRTESHSYTVVEDDMGGQVETVWPSDYDPETGDLPNWRVRFAFRRLADDSVAVGAFGPDLAPLPEVELLRWRADLLQAPAFADSDPPFERWHARYLEGSWDVEDGPRVGVEGEIERINALSREILGQPLFKWEAHPQLKYPAAQNTQAYTDAAVNLYQLVGDGLQPKALEPLAALLNVNLENAQHRFKSLKQILPAELRPIICRPLRDVEEQREAVHGIRSAPPASREAFGDFDELLTKVERALRALKTWLERTFQLDAEVCLERERAMVVLPEISGPPRPEFKLAEVKKAEGKTVKCVEFGAPELPEDVGPSEAIILHFTDGSAMALTVGSNAGDLAFEHEGMSAGDLSTDIMVFWVPPLRTLSQPGDEE